LAADLPNIPAGTIVRLAADEWYPRPGVVGHTSAEVRVVRIDPAGAADTVAWIRGHGVECAWESVDCPQPWCYEVLVRVEVLRRAAAQL
jgi:hypothetical protein